MAYEVISGAKKYFKYSECKKGDVLVDGGSYIGSEQGKFGIQHLFDVAGTTTVLNSAGQLNKFIDEKLVSGDKVRVTYDGTFTLTKGQMAGKDCHQFIVERDRAGATTGDVVEDTPSPAVVAKTTTTKAKPTGKMTL